jgi:hypothetical protein
MAKISPTQLTLRKLREDGYIAQVVEKWNMFARVKQDLWGFDVIAAKRGEAVLVQCTSASNIASRVTKVQELDTTARLREAGFRLLVWGWKKTKNRWHVLERDIS